MVDFADEVFNMRELDVMLKWSHRARTLVTLCAHSGSTQIVVVFTKGAFDYRTG